MKRVHRKPKRFVQNMVHQTPRISRRYSRKESIPWAKTHHGMGEHVDDTILGRRSGSSLRGGRIGILGAGKGVEASQSLCRCDASLMFSDRKLTGRT